MHQWHLKFPYPITSQLDWQITIASQINGPISLILPSFDVTWDQAQFLFHFVNNIPVGKAKRVVAVAVRENVWEPLKLGLISGYIWCDTTHFVSEDDYRTGFWSVIHCYQQSYSGLLSPGRSCSTYLWNDSWVPAFHMLILSVKEHTKITLPSVFSLKNHRQC